MHHALLRRARRALVVVAIGVALVGLALAGCTMVGDSLMGVRLDRLLSTTCGKQCADQKNVDLKAEIKLHEANVALCKSTYPPGDPGRQPCLAAEDARHTARVGEIQQAYVDCQDGCHKQGTGSAG